MASPNSHRLEPDSSSDLYNTPVEALDALYKHVPEAFNSDNAYLEPCNGLGKISDYLKSKGLDVVTNELYDYGIKTDYQEDFLNPSVYAEDDWFSAFDTIISNPPYNKAVDFVLKGFEVADEQYLLLRSTFLEGKARYKKLMSLGKLEKVYMFTYRISCSKGVNEEPSPNSVCYSWFKFNKNYNGLPTLEWLVK